MKKLLTLLLVIVSLQAQGQRPEIVFSVMGDSIISGGSRIEDSAAFFTFYFDSSEHYEALPFTYFEYDVPDTSTARRRYSQYIKPKK